MHNLAREKGYARQVALYLTMNIYQPKKPFSDPFAKSGWWVLLEHATVDEIAQRDWGELMGVCVKPATTTCLIPRLRQTIASHWHPTLTACRPD